MPEKAEDCVKHLNVNHNLLLEFIFVSYDIFFDDCMLHVAPAVISWTHFYLKKWKGVEWAQS